MNTIENKRVLVTGGAGFIGSNLCENLLFHNNSVRCLDNLSTGSIENLQDFKDHPNFTFIEGDIRSLETCRQASENIDLILHQAALGSVPRSIHDPLATNSVNVDGFLNVLVAARDNGVKRFVYAASSSTYGDSTALPKIEEHIGKPLSPYAVSKYVNELYAHVFALNYGMEVIGLRYFNVFGRRQSPDGAYAAVIPLMVSALIRHEEPIIFGDGTNTRDYTYIDNIILMNHLAATTTNSAALGQVFNTAAGERTSLNELVNVLKEELAVYDKEISAIKAQYRDPRTGDVPHSQAAINKAADLLKYKPSHSFRKGIKEAIDWYWSAHKHSA